MAESAACRQGQHADLLSCCLVVVDTLRYLDDTIPLAPLWNTAVKPGCETRL
jgi:hypothetical protein